MKKINLLIVLLLIISLPICKVYAEDVNVIQRETQSEGVKVSGLKVTNEDSYADWEFFYNKDTKNFEVVYTITGDAPDEITIELSLVQDVLNACGKADFINWGVTDEEIQNNLNNGITYMTGTMDYGNKQTFKINLESLKATTVLEPGDTLNYNITIKNESGKIYSYKKESLIITTGALEKTDNDEVGFDGQVLPEEYEIKSLNIGYNLNLDDHNVINNLVDEAIKFKPIKGYPKYVDANGNDGNSKTTIKVLKNQKVVKINNVFYIEAGSYLVKTKKSSSSFNLDNDGNYRAKNDFTITYTYAYDSNLNQVYNYYNRKTASSSEIMKSVNAYLNEYYEGKIENYILDYYNKKNNTSYENVNDLLNNNTDALSELMVTSARSIGKIDVYAAARYNNFFISLFSVVIGDEEDVKKYEEENEDSWGYNDGSTTVSKYMDEEVNKKDDGAWKKADNYLDTKLDKLENGKDANFTLATNVDGYKTANDYMNYAWSWFSSIKMFAEKRKLTVSYITEDGEKLSDDIISEMYLNSSYETEKKSFDKYELISIKGNETGTLTEDTEVIYIYQFIEGEGEEKEEEENIIEPLNKKEEIKNPEIYTGVEENLKSKSFIVMTVSLVSTITLLVLKRKIK